MAGSAYRGTQEGRQRVGVLVEVPCVLRELGADPGRVFEDAGVDPRVLDNPENEISFVAMGRLLDACVQATDCEHFGLLAGSRLTLRSLGIVGDLMRSAPTLESALSDLVQSQTRNADGAVCYLRRTGQHAALCYAVYQPGTPAVHQISEGAIALAFNAILELAGPVAFEVRLAHAKPRDAASFKRFFGVPVRFDSEESGVVLPREALSMQLRAENTDERARLQRQVRAHAALSDPDFRTEVVRLLRSRVVFGGTSSEEVAHYFSLHPRSLLRKLRAYGTTFRTLLGDMRFEVACQLLEGTRLSVTEIGIVLGYADTAIFTRAFERWSGTAPSRWRGRHHAGPSLARTYSGSPIRRPTEASGPWRGPPTNGADRHRRVHVRKGQAS